MMSGLRHRRGGEAEVEEVVVEEGAQKEKGDVVSEAAGDRVGQRVVRPEEVTHEISPLIMPGARSKRFDILHCGSVVLG